MATIAKKAAPKKAATPTKKAQFSIVHPGKVTLAPGELTTMTIRSHDQYNTTIYTNNDRYRGVYNQRDVLFLNANEMKKRGLALEDRVDIHTLSSDGIERVIRGFKVVDYLMPDGCCAAYYPEANTLLPLYAYDRISGTPSAKAIPVVLKRPSNVTAERPPTTRMPQ